jgi:hypothetical protein
MDYIRLTKEKKDNNGRTFITCKFEGTTECPIHICESCGNCTVFQAMLKQLYKFENAWDEMVRTGGKII